MQPWLYSPHANVEKVKRMTIRDRIRKWLGIDNLAQQSLHNHEDISALRTKLGSQDADIYRLNGELTEFKAELRLLTAPARSIPVYHDFESAQVAALDEFKEK